MKLGREEWISKKGKKIIGVMDIRIFMIFNSVYKYGRQEIYIKFIFVY